MSIEVKGQTFLSLATDVGVLHSFKKGQRFFTFGHTIQAQVHFTKKDALYFWLSYYIDGKFENKLEAFAKAPATVPQQIKFTNNAAMRLRQFSVGWKRYLKGSYDNEKTYNYYGYAGWGILFGKMINEFKPAIDTALYVVPISDGEGSFKRLTIDLGLGMETHLGNAWYLYGEGRVWLTTSDFPSKYLYVNNDAPIMGMLNVGLRILFD